MFRFFCATIHQSYLISKKTGNTSLIQPRNWWVTLLIQADRWTSGQADKRTGGKSPSPGGEGWGGAITD